jgi:3-methyladenine DNA glycosylase AlkD
MTAEVYIQSLEQVYRRAGNAIHAAGASQYMRNQFEYFGIGTPERRKISKQFLMDHPGPSGKELNELTRKLWIRPKRECQYFAMELLELKMKQGESIDISLLEFLIQHKSWWDTVDFIAPKLAGGVLGKDKKRLEKTALKWMASDNLWLKRSAILLQLKFKKETDTRLLERLIMTGAPEPDFFIRKAIGWALREYSKTNPAWVKNFVKINGARLSPLSKKEALKRIA